MATKFLDLMSQSLIHDKENFQNTYKKLTTTMKRMDTRAAKLQLAIKSGKGNKSLDDITAELTVLENKRLDILAYFKHYITLRYCKWTQAWCLVMDAHLSYHTAAVATMESARSIWSEIAKKNLPIEPELEERRQSARRSDLDSHKESETSGSQLNVKANTTLVNESYKQLIESTGVDTEKEKRKRRN